MWIFLVLVYGILKGVREIVKKKSMEKSSVLEVLFFYTFFSFLFVAFDWKTAMEVPMQYMPGIALKALFVFSAWIFSFKAVKQLPLSLYGVLDLTRVLFATLLALTFLHEKLTLQSAVGLLLVCIGLLMLKRPKTKIRESEKVPAKLVIFAILSCLLNALSGLLDKVLMSGQELEAAQLQFWYMLFMVLYYLFYILFSHTRIRVKESLKNPWIWLLAVLFVIADRCLFLANADPASKITIMTLIKQSGAIVTILAGRFLFKEKDTTHKLICAGVIIAGIVCSVL